MNEYEEKIEAVYSRATFSQLTDGVSWYQEAAAFIHDKKGAVPIHQACAVVAALSPRVDWQKNKMVAAEMLKANTSDMIGISYAGIFKASSKKALACLQSKGGCADMLPLLGAKALKVKAFYSNLLEAATGFQLLSGSEGITLDAHAIAVCTDTKKPNEKEKKKMREAYLRVAEKKELKGYELQAICWVAQRGSAH